ncbi:2'-5' RNA ligase family protein [uncultured Nocardioides sp.]|uniref:2'-5' RNA ligase family protein n=1 Tax=uncultured Nocardioides sp. TaxID=198441 RepID=UPI002631D75B|nr:2'-5' RNA ligase family protein [uncultured Nocardioides sp.]
MTGHTCLALPVPALEGWVRERTAHYDESFVSADPAFSHAHLTLLSPWVPAPSPADLQRVGEVLAEVGASTVVLTSVEVFPDGLVHAVPEPDGPLRELTATLVEAFPAYPPYGGRYGEPTPHVTLDRVGPQVGLGWVRAALGDLLPAELVVDRVDLQWWGNDACRRLHSWPLGGSA